MAGLNMESWFQKPLYNISHDNDVISNLSDIKIALSTLNSNQLKYTSSSLSLSILFDCLNSSDRNQIVLACEVLKPLLNALDPTTIWSLYGVQIVRALNHPIGEVKKLVLLELNRAAFENDLAPLLSRDLDLLLSVVECVGNEEIAVSRQCIQFLVRLGSTSPGLEAIYSPNVLQALTKVLNSNAINRCRVYEIVIGVSESSLPGLNASHASGILQKFILELKSDDVLVMLNTLEFAIKLAVTHNGFNYLESQGVVKFLANHILNMESNPMVSLILTGLIKFFGNVAQSRPEETFRDYNNVMRMIFNLVRNKDNEVDNVECVVLETVGYIATTCAGKQMLQKQGEMRFIMHKLFEVITKRPTANRVRGLNALVNIITLQLSDQDTEMLGTVKSWFDFMGPAAETMSEIMNMAQKPFAEMKSAVLSLIKALSEQPWGQHYIYNTPGLVELLLDRSNNNSFLEHSTKYAMIKRLSESPTSESIFGEETVKRFKKYVTEGIVHVPILTEVAIEKAD